LQRAKVGGKQFRKSLLKVGEESMSFTTAKLRLPDMLRDEQLQPGRPGMTGELHFGGAGLARGYHSGAVYSQPASRRNATGTALSNR
jgi:hypothetical protein